MSQSSAASLASVTEIPAIPFTKLAPWVLFVGLLGMLVIFFVSADQGAVSVPAGTLIHEWVHDARHLLGYPCH